MSTRLQLYNQALRYCGEGPLSSLTENREPRRLLDQVWDDGAVDACLERAQWKFAIRTVRQDYDPSVTPDFGFSRAFQQPDDFIILSAISADEYFNEPLTRFESEAGFWYAEQDTIYVRYVSNDSAYGGDTSNWSAAFSDYFACYLAENIVMRLTSDPRRQEVVMNQCSKLLREAKSIDAIQGPTRFPPPGSWHKARWGSSSGRRDRGSRGSLIG